MTIDDCEYSFDQLALEVLPRYLEQLRNRMGKPIPMREFGVKGVGPKALQARYGLARDPSGCYVLIENAKPIYVGISQHVIQRLLEHVRGGDHLTATLAYRVARARHHHGATAAQAMQNPSFRAAFDEAVAYILSLDAAFIEISNPLELYVFEAYAAMELQTGLDAGGWNTFVTH